MTKSLEYGKCLHGNRKKRQNPLITDLCNFSCFWFGAPNRHQHLAKTTMGRAPNELLDVQILRVTLMACVTLILKKWVWRHWSDSCGVGMKEISKTGYCWIGGGTQICKELRTELKEKLCLNWVWFHIKCPLEGWTRIYPCVVRMVNRWKSHITWSSHSLNPLYQQHVLFYMGRRVSMPDSRMCGLCQTQPASSQTQTQTPTQAPGGGDCKEMEIAGLGFNHFSQSGYRRRK